MHRRIHGLGRVALNVELKVLFTCLLLKFEEGDLIPLPILRKIEEMYEKDQAKMNSAFNGFNKCSSKGLSKIIK